MLNKLKFYIVSSFMFASSLLASNNLIESIFNKDSYTIKCEKNQCVGNNIKANKHFIGNLKFNPKGMTFNDDRNELNYGGLENMKEFFFNDLIVQTILTNSSGINYGYDLNYNIPFTKDGVEHLEVTNISKSDYGFKIKSYDTKWKKTPLEYFSKNKSDLQFYKDNNFNATIRSYETNLNNHDIILRGLNNDINILNHELKNNKENLELKDTLNYAKNLKNVLEKHGKYFKIEDYSIDIETIKTKNKNKQNYKLTLNMNDTNINQNYKLKLNFSINDLTKFDTKMLKIDNKFLAILLAGSEIDINGLEIDINVSQLQKEHKELMEKNESYKDSFNFLMKIINNEFNQLSELEFTSKDTTNQEAEKINEKDFNINSFFYNIIQLKNSHFIAKGKIKGDTNIANIITSIGINGFDNFLNDNNLQEILSLFDWEFEER